MEIEFKHKQTTIKIGNTEYNISLYLSASDVISISEFIESGAKEYNVIIAKVIEKHIIPMPTPNSLVDAIATDNNALHTFISEIIHEDENLKVIYDKYETENDIYYRFLSSVNEHWSIEARKSATIIANTFQESLSKINIQSSQYLNTLTETLDKLKNVIEPYNRFTEKIANTLTIFNQRINNLFSGIKSPHISDERKELLCQSYETWGDFGWTILPQAAINLYNQPPETRKQANEIAMAYCKNKDMLDLFEDTKNLKGVKKKDFEEAVFAFQNRKYKSCAMILFSLIDAKLIRMQKKEDLNIRTKRRDSGKQAVENIKKRIESEHDINNKFFLLLSYKNLFACLSEFFKSGNDFKKQPELANRNFIDHGMLTRDVRKRDCIQLFLLYYNFLEFFEIINNNSNTIN